MSGQAAHPDVTWPLSRPPPRASPAVIARPSSSVVDNGQVTGAPPAAQGENDSDNAQPKSQDFVSKAE
ncbi:hypothetical protein TYRP_016855 [Tyrophagus putrescentiae]|nr:hypothetical protein TYRP_016855 [Tyrophagus putrescentiae]